MAVTSIWPIKGRVDKVVNYARNPEKTAEEYLGEQSAMHTIDGVVEYAADELKTEKREYVTCLNCKEEDAVSQFIETKNTGRRPMAASATTAISPSSRTRLMRRPPTASAWSWQRSFGATGLKWSLPPTATPGIITNHFVINSVSCVDGYIVLQTPEDYRRMREVPTGSAVRQGCRS
jgi:hypothetical protein